MLGLRALAGALLLLSIVSCGGAVTTPASGSPDASSDGPGTTSTLSCSTLTLAGPVQQVSPASAPGGMLTSASAGDGSVLVGWNEPSRDPPSMFLVREVGFDGAPLGSAAAPLTGAGLVAQGSGHAAAVTEGDFGQCTFVPIGAGGAAAGSPVQVATYGCGLFRATPSGFALIVGTEDVAGPISLDVLDTSGHTPTTATLSNAGMAHAAWTALADGSFLLVGQSPDLSNCACPQPVFAQHFSAAGQPLASQQRVGAAFLQSMAVSAAGDGVLLAAAPWQGALVGVQPLDADGVPRGGAAALVAADGGAIESTSARAVDVVRVSDQAAIVAWIETTGTMAAHVVAQAVSTSGAPLSPPLDVAPASGAHLRLAATPMGALVVWDGQAAGPVSAVPLRCGG